MRSEESVCSSEVADAEITQIIENLGSQSEGSICNRRQTGQSCLTGCKKQSSELWQTSVGGRKQVKTSSRQRNKPEHIRFSQSGGSQAGSKARQFSNGPSRPCPKRIMSFPRQKIRYAGGWRQADRLSERCQHGRELAEANKIQQKEKGVRLTPNRSRIVEVTHGQVRRHTSRSGPIQSLQGQGKET